MNAFAPTRDKRISIHSDSHVPGRSAMDWTRRMPMISNSYSSRSAKWPSLAILFVGVLVLQTRTSQATPAYGRRYDTACATCHSPLPPRLNNVGMLFRRAGFRLPDSDENGKLTLKMISAHGIGDAASLSANLDARHDPEANEPGTSRSTMSLGELELVAGTAIDDHLSTQLMFVPHSDEGEVEVEDYEAQANVGKPAHQFSVRAGLMQTLLWQKANHGSLTPSAPLVLDEEPVAPVGDFRGFTLGAKQVGVEGGYTFTRLQGGHVLATMLSVAALNGVRQDGAGASRNPTDGVDVLVQGYALVGSRNTIGAFYYNGRTAVDPEGLLPSPGPFKDRFDRAGVVASVSPVERVELTGSVVGGKDRSEQLPSDVSSLGGYVELTGSIMPHWLATYRWEQIDPDRDTGGDLVHANVVATSCQLWEHLLLSAEYRELREAGQRPHSLLARARLIY